MGGLACPPGRRCAPWAGILYNAGATGAARAVMTAPGPRPFTPFSNPNLNPHLAREIRLLAAKSFMWLRLIAFSVPSCRPGRHRRRTTGSDDPARLSHLPSLEALPITDPRYRCACTARKAPDRRVRRGAPRHRCHRRSQGNHEQAILAAEDNAFTSIPGDQGVIRAAYSNLTSGGSVRRLHHHGKQEFLPQQRKPLPANCTRRCLPSKSGEFVQDEILQIYINQIYLDSALRLRGIIYYGKALRYQRARAAMLAGLLNPPR